MTTLDRTLATLLALSVLLFATREAHVLAQTRSRRPDIVVSISGAVARPQVLRLPAEARLVHAIEACGGLTRLADREAVELAKPLCDGDHLVIASSPQKVEGDPPLLGDLDLQMSEENVPTASRFPSVVEQLPPPKPRRPRPKRGARARRKAAAPEAIGVIDINTATMEELDRLPGVGPVLAQRILSAREAAPGATFSSLEELETIRGIKGKTLLRLRPHLKLEGS